MIRFALATALVLVVPSFAAADAPLAAKDALVTGVWADDTGHVLAVGRDGRVVESVDRGATWSSRASPTTADLHAVWSDGRGHGVAVGARGTALFLDHGAWKLATIGTMHDLRALWGDGDWIVAVGGTRTGDDDEGVIAWSGDGGASWTHAIVHDTRLVAVAGTDPDHVVAVGSKGAIYATDGRHVWRPIATPFIARDGHGGRVTSNSLVLTDLVAITHAGKTWFALGSGGTVLVSGDGVAWTIDQALQPGTSLDFQGFGLVARSAQVVALGRWERATRRAGKWHREQMAALDGPALVGFAVTASGITYAVGYEGGRTPNPRYYSNMGCPRGAGAPPCPESINVPYRGTIARSTDGGATWSKLVK